jgi:hypothetical protein
MRRAAQPDVPPSGHELPGRCVSSDKRVEPTELLTTPFDNPEVNFSIDECEIGAGSFFTGLRQPDVGHFYSFYP